MKQLYIICCLLFFLLWGGTACGSGNDSPDGNDDDNLPEVLDPVAVSKSNAMKVYAHYMPWFETPETSTDGKWGQHWTMGNRNPDRTDAGGKREIASHYYPLIGPYASSDAVVLNYHVMLMKYAGIDGVMIDWYGTQDKYDYAANRRNTEELVKALDRAGLEFAIVYEDQTVKELPDNNAKVTQAIKDMSYLQNNFFKKKNYIKIDGKPLLMVFGPQGVTTAPDWTNVFGNLNPKPIFIVLNDHSHLANNNTIKNAAGEYLWVQPDPETFYSRAGDFDYYIGGAMPGFNDYYQEGDWGDGYTTYPDEGGALFTRQLKVVSDAGLDYLQISTWNDFGEGTNIEPAREYNYRYLTALQQFTGVSYREDVLQQIYRWYELKQQHVNGSDIASTSLTQAFYYFISLQPDKAVELMDELDN